MSMTGNGDRLGFPGADDVVVTARSPRDLVAAVRSLMGFQPEDSAVMIDLAGTRIVCVARVDLPSSADTWDISDRDVAQMVSAAVNAGADSVVLVGFGPHDRVKPFMDKAVAPCEAAGLRVIDALRVADGRYFSYRCQDLRCCPADGVPFDLDLSPVTTAAAVVSGYAALPSRSAVVGSIAPASAAAAQVMCQLVDAAGRRLAGVVNTSGVAVAVRVGLQVVAAATDRYRSGGRCDDEEMAALLACLLNTRVRDVAGDATDGEEPWQIDIWRDATRRASPGVVAAPATLLAVLAWCRGDGVLAKVAVQRALDDNADYPLAQVLAEVLREGLPPTVLDSDDRWGVGAGASASWPGEVPHGDGASGHSA